jgi:hypothetical protein
MALNEKKRQKKLQKEKAKRKEIAKAARRSLGTGLSGPNPYGTLATAERLARASDGPIHQCLVPRELFENGIGSVLVSREVGDGLLAVAILLVDVYCLGVKDAYLRIVTPLEYDDFLRDIALHETLERVTPAYARKLVEDSVAYARDLGLSPHPDYEKTKRIWGTIDPAECPVNFEFGKDGKPFYVTGPNDTPARVRQVMEALTQSRGPNEFHYLAGLDPRVGLSLYGDDDLLLEEGEEAEGEEAEGEEAEEETV